MVWVPCVRAVNDADVTVQVTPSLALLKEPSEADMAVPVPLVPTESMKNSAAAMLLLPLEVSLTEAVTVGAAFVGVGETVTPEVAGATLSIVTVALELLPTLPVLS